MKGPPVRGRSNTAGSAASNQTRPVSRASTASVNTTDEQTTQTIPPEARASQSSNGPDLVRHQYSIDGLFGLGRQQFGYSEEQHAIDPFLQHQETTENAPTPRDTTADSVQPSHKDDTVYPPSNTHPFQDNESFVNTNDGSQDEAGAGNAKKKKGSASSIANDQELRRLYQENKARTLRNVADSVLQEERGPKSEKTKQIFAMIWLSTVCRKGSNSVPRNRVFSYYATRCGNERVPPLNPASFGKLVRIIFPGIQTRRLGMRGESKYHYVNLEMVENVPECRPDGMNPHSEGRFCGASERASFPRQRVHPSADTAVFPPPNLSKTGSSTSRNRHSLGSVSRGNLYLFPHLPTTNGGYAPHEMASRHLKFPTTDGTPEHDQQEIELPSLHGFMPPGTDPDVADALRALYRTHCIAVIDGFRYCKEKTFYHSFTSFHGTLTVPVQKLLAYPGLAPWIKECDWLMYQKMIRFVAPLALQAMPVRVIDTFRTVAQKLGPHILNTFQHHPAHVRDARHGPAMIFASLLDRLLRVNATAHAAANILTDSTSRNQMWFDWVYCVRPTTVVETSLPGHGYTRTLQILTNEIRELLGPLQCIKYDGMQPIFAAVANEHETEIAHQMQIQLDSSSPEGVLDRWNNFLTDLPSRFPHADARTLIHCVGAVSSAALRDITMADAKSFGYWCVTKTWVEEMLQWLAEKGGFLESTPDTMVMRPHKRTAENAGFDIEVEDETNGAHPSTWTGYEEGLDQHSHQASPEMLQSLDNPQDHAGLPHPNPPFRTDREASSQPLNHDSNRRYTQPASSSYATSQTIQYGASSNREHYNEGPAHQQPAYEQQLPQAANSPSKVDKTPMIPPHVARETEAQDTNDDSGICLDLELPPQRTPVKLDYNAFMNTTGTASDPADVVVC